MANRHAGWRSPTGLYLDDPLEGFGLTSEDSAILQSLVMVGRRDQVEFLGGSSTR